MFLLLSPLSFKRLPWYGLTLLFFTLDISVNAWFTISIIYATYSWFFTTALLPITRLQRLAALVSALLVTSFYGHDTVWVFVYLASYAYGAFLARNIIIGSVTLCALCTLIGIGAVIKLSGLYIISGHWFATILITIGMVNYMYQQGDQGNRSKHVRGY